MRESLLPLLACPACGADLVVARRDSPAGSPIQDGELACQKCQLKAPIQRGIPDFTGQSLSEESRLTQENFGYSWNSFHQTERHFDEQFEAWIAPATPKDFEGQLVLDAGCGMGRHSDLVARSGAKAVVAVDFSSAVFPAERRLHDHENAHVVRADIYALPLKPVFDIAYSVGVLHHLPDPRRGFLSMVGRVRPGGRVIAWLYGAENNEWITGFVSPLREKLLSRLPMPLLKAAAFGLTAGAVFPALKLVYRPAAAVPALQKRLFYASYLSTIAPYSFNHIYGIVFDHLLPPVAFYLREDEVQEWAQATRLEAPVVRWHNRMSWTLVGRVPDRAESLKAKASA